MVTEVNKGLHKVVKHHLTKRKENNNNCLGRRQGGFALFKEPKIAIKTKRRGFERKRIV